MSKLVNMQEQDIKNLVYSNPEQALEIFQIENDSLTQAQFRKLRVAETICCSLALVGLFCGAIISDTTYSESFQESVSDSSNLIQLMGTFTTLALLLAITWRYSQFLKLQQANGTFSNIDDLSSTGLYKYLLSELFVSAVHPVYTPEPFTFEQENRVFRHQITYTYNSFISVFMMVRLYHVFRLVSVFSSYQSPRYNRLSVMNGKSLSVHYALKCLVKEEPIKTLVLIFAGGILVISYCLRVFERPLEKFSDNNFGDYNNSVWCVVITMTTVGYGDYFPVTEYGRLAGLVACIFGLVVIGLLVVVFFDHLVLSRSQSNSLLVIKRIQARKDMKHFAASLIASGFRLKKYYQEYPFDTKQLSVLLRKFRTNVNNFQRIRIRIRNLYTLDTFKERFDNTLNDIYKSYELILIKSERIDELLKSLNC